VQLLPGQVSPHVQIVVFAVVPQVHLFVVSICFVFLILID
jgi:hypothetical protein